MKDFQVLIPAYNEEKTIERCLNSILKQERVDSLNWGILIIANNCSDNTVKVVKDFISREDSEKRIILLETSERGKSKALNIGMKYEKTKKFVVADADSYLEKSCLIKVYGEFENKDVKIVGALDKPVFSNKKSLLYEYQVDQQLYREMRGRVLPVGRFYMFDSDVIDSFPEFLHSEDTWIDLEIAKKFGWSAVKVVMDAIVYFTPADNWLDYIKQESRFECGLPQIIEYFPELESVWEGRRAKSSVNDDKKVIFDTVREKLKRENINIKRIDEFDNIILDIIEDNSNLMKSSLITEEGLWEPIISTKK